MCEKMKIVEDYAQRKEDAALKEREKEFVNNLDKEGLPLADIARIADVSQDFIKKTLTEYLP
jgi:DNA-directed RNA polymerase specialized sigma subunit